MSQPSCVVSAGMNGARDVFQAKRIVIVSQKYHLYRALYMAFCLQPVAPPLSCQIFHEADAVENLRKAALPQRGGSCGRARGRGYLNYRG